MTVYGYATVVICLWLTVEVLADRAGLATLIAFGPRWMVTLPLVPLALIVGVSTRGRQARRLIALLALTVVIVVFGFMGYRIGLGRAAGTPVLRIMTYNIGGSGATAEGLDRLMRAERIDVAALQECERFYNNDLVPFDWHFYYGGNLCLVSRYRFGILDDPDPESAWRRHQDPDRFEIDTPLGRLQFLNVHLETIRGGLEALGDQPWSGLSQLAANREESARQSRTARARTLGIGPIVIAGDFNLPVESAIYRANWGDLQNAFSSCGRGSGHTKFTMLFGIRIDHVVASDPWRCADARVLPRPFGGDHAPLVVDLVIRN